MPSSRTVVLIVFVLTIIISCRADDEPTSAPETPAEDGEEEKSTTLEPDPFTPGAGEDSMPSVDPNGPPAEPTTAPDGEATSPAESTPVPAGAVDPPAENHAEPEEKDKPPENSPASDENEKPTEHSPAPTDSGEKNSGEKHHDKGAKKNDDEICFKKAPACPCWPAYYSYFYYPYYYYPYSYLYSYSYCFYGYG